MVFKLGRGEVLCVVWIAEDSLANSRLYMHGFWFILTGRNLEGPQALSSGRGATVTSGRIAP